MPRGSSQASKVLEQFRAVKDMESFKKTEPLACVTSGQLRAPARPVCGTVIVGCCTGAPGGGNVRGRLDRA